jgi:hypothetical protein
MPWISINEWKRKNKIGLPAKPKKEKAATNLQPSKPVFKLMGYDTFSDEWYCLDKFPTEKAARVAGVKRLEELAVSQPTASSGGQNGIQDQVYIEHPDGKRYRVIG